MGRVPGLGGRETKGKGGVKEERAAAVGVWKHIDCWERKARAVFGIGRGGDTTCERD